MFNTKTIKFVNRTYSELLNLRSSIISKLKYTVVFIYPRPTFINLGNLVISLNILIENRLYKVF